MDHARLGHGLGHGARFFHSAGKGFFADVVLACLGGGNGYFGVNIVGGADIDHINIGAGNDCAPIGRSLIKAKALAGGFRRRIGDIDHNLAVRDGRGGPEEHGHGGVSHGMGLAHEPAADHGNVHHLGHHNSPELGMGQRVRGRGSIRPRKIVSSPSSF